MHQIRLPDIYDKSPPIAALKSYPELLSLCFQEYEKNLHTSGLTARLFSGAMDLLEDTFPNAAPHSKVLELGAGGDYMLRHLKRQTESYLVTDIREFSVIKPDTVGQVQVKKHDVYQFNPAWAGSFDRVIANHLLEHLNDPEVRLQEWIRYLRPGGVLSLILPCDPGLLWRFGRHRLARKHPRLTPKEYQYLMAKEHVNPIDKMIHLIHYRYPKAEESYYPFKVLPVFDFNLFYIVHIANEIGSLEPNSARH